MDWLSGKKTYIGIIGGVIWALLGVFGYIDPASDIYKTVATVILAFTGISVRLGIEKSGAAPTE
jgi:hypothetical protein